MNVEMDTSLQQPLVDPDDRPKRSQVRWRMLALGFFGITCAYITRLNLSLAIVAMVRPPQTATSNSTYIDFDQASQHPPRFVWDSTTQALILGSFFYTYGLLQVPGARWCERHGAKWPCFFIILGCGVISALLPIAASHGVWAVVTLRALLGLCQSAVYPAYYALLSRWFPEQEQSTALGTLSNGGFAGAILAMLLTGFFCEHEFLGGWPSVFYTSAIVCFVWCGFWAAHASDYPAFHPFISDNELRHIQRNKRLQSAAVHNGATSPDAATQADLDHSTPWVAIFTSRQVWAVIVAKFGIDWVFWLLMLNLPLYLNHVLHVRIHQNGLINSALNAMLMVSNGGGGLLADHIVARRLASKTLIRKAFQAASVLGSSLCLLAIPLFQSSSSITVIALLLLLMLVFGLNIGGDIPIVIDMTEHYPATIFAIANSICSACGFIVPLFTGFVLDDHAAEPGRWTFVFLMAVLVNCICLAFFVRYASSDPLFKPRVYRMDTERLLHSDQDTSEADPESGDENGLISKRRSRPY